MWITVVFASQVAGFFGVLSSELSVYTLAVITMERNYAITHAMHLNKRLSLRHASYIMTIGWFFALIMALLPLVGVSDYRKFAVCLPFEVGNSVSKGYVIFLMFINGVAFLILMGCYLKVQTEPKKVTFNSCSYLVKKWTWRNGSSIRPMRIYNKSSMDFYFEWWK